MLSGEVEGTDAKIDVAITEDGETFVLTTRVQQAKSGPRRKDTEIRLPVESLKKAMRLLAPEPTPLWTPTQGAEIQSVPSGEFPPAPSGIAGFAMSPDELQISGVPIGDDDFTPKPRPPSDADDPT